MMISKVIKCAFPFLSCLVTGVAYANLLTNGSFEDGNWSGTGGSNGTSNGSWGHVSAGSSKITGWTVGGEGVDWHNGVEMPNPYGKYVVDLNGGRAGSVTQGSISQSFATTVGESYQLSFYLSNPYGYSSSSPLLRVDIAGNTYQFAPSSNKDWVKETIDFTAVSSTTTLSFSSLNGSGYWGPVIDNVSINTALQPATVSEPSILLLGLVSLASMIGFQKRPHKIPLKDNLPNRISF